MKTKLVTAFVPLHRPDYYEKSGRSVAKYHGFGERMLSLGVPIRAYVDYPLEECWMYQYLQGLDRQPPFDNTGDPDKITMDYITVCHQKQTFLRMAQAEDPDYDVYVWIDYVTLQIPGITEEHILQLVSDVNDETIALPGCEPKGTPGMWRFCGTIICCPGKYVIPFDDAVRAKIKQNVAEGRQVRLDFYTWAQMEFDGVLPIRQYDSTGYGPWGHGPGMLLNYNKGES